MRRCYILVRQIFFVSNGVHYQSADDNPVSEVFTSAEAAISRARQIVVSHIHYCHQPLHIEEQKPSSELIYKIGAFDPSGICDVSYSVVKKGMMV